MKRDLRVSFFVVFSQLISVMVFRNQIGEFLNGVTGKVDEMGNTLDKQFNDGQNGLPNVPGGNNP